MKKKPLAFAAIILLVVTVFLTRNFFYSEKAPQIHVNTIDGQIFSLDRFTGKALLVTFWATTCSICIREMPLLIDLYEELNKEGLEILGIAMHYDPPNRVVALSRKKNIPYPVALDTENKMARAFGGITVTPTSFLIGTNGVIIRRQHGKLDIERLETAIRRLISKQ